VVRKQGYWSWTSVYSSFIVLQPVYKPESLTCCCLLISEDEDDSDGIDDDDDWDDWSIDWLM